MTQGHLRSSAAGLGTSVITGRSWIAVHFAVAAIWLVLFLSCDRSDSESKRAAGGPTAASAAGGEPGGGLSPTEVVGRVRELRLAGRIEQLKEHLLPEQRGHIVELIQAMDQLLSANQVLQASVRRNLGPATAAAFDRSEAENAIGVFSTDVDILRERVEGDKAFLTLQVAGRVPLEEVELVRVDGRWLIKTDAPIPEVPRQLRKLADVLVEAARRLDTERMTAGELQRELASQQAPIGRRLAELTGSSRG